MAVVKTSGTSTNIDTSVQFAQPNSTNILAGFMDGLQKAFTPPKSDADLTKKKFDIISANIEEAKQAQQLKASYRAIAPTLTSLHEKASTPGVTPAELETARAQAGLDVLTALNEQQTPDLSPPEIQALYTGAQAMVTGLGKTQLTTVDGAEGIYNPMTGEFSTINLNTEDYIRELLETKNPASYARVLQQHELAASAKAGSKPAAEATATANAIQNSLLRVTELQEQWDYIEGQLDILKKSQGVQTTADASVGFDEEDAQAVRVFQHLGEARNQLSISYNELGNNLKGISTESNYQLAVHDWEQSALGLVNGNINLVTDKSGQKDSFLTEVKTMKEFLVANSPLGKSEKEKRRLDLKIGIAQQGFKAGLPSEILFELTEAPNLQRTMMALLMTRAFGNLATIGDNPSSWRFWMENAEKKKVASMKQATDLLKGTDLTDEANLPDIETNSRLAIAQLKSQLVSDVKALSAKSGTYAPEMSLDMMIEFADHIYKQDALTKFGPGSEAIREDTAKVLTLFNRYVNANESTKEQYLIILEETGVDPLAAIAQTYGIPYTTPVSVK